MSKRVVVLAVMACLLGSSVPGLAATPSAPAGNPTQGSTGQAAPSAPTSTIVPSLLGSLEQAEMVLYGQTQQGFVLQRIGRIETDLFGTEPQDAGSLLVRIQRINSYLATGELTGLSLQTKLNVTEWRLFAQLNYGLPLAERVRMLEQQIYGASREGALASRIDELSALIWPGGRIELVPTRVPAATTLVKIRLLDDLDSSANAIGDRVRYQVAEDVLVSNALIIPVGSPGSGVVTDVRKAGSLGQDGLLKVNFGAVAAIDGSPVYLQAGERSTESNRSLETAAAATMAGVILLGPPGILGGVLVRGKDVKIPKGTEFFLEVSQPTSVRALPLGPVQSGAATSSGASPGATGPSGGSGTNPQQQGASQGASPGR